MSTRVRYEQRSTLLALKTYLESNGWSGMGITYTDGYQTETVITVPQVVVTFPPSHIRTLQMGRVAGKDRMYVRRIQVDVYMEDEPRTQSILDTIMDFFDETCIYIKNESNTELGTLICYNSETIFADTIPPLMATPKNLRWRGVVRAELEAHYPG